MFNTKVTTNSWTLRFPLRTYDKSLAAAAQSAYVIWRRRYPQWHEALFDEEFMVRRVLPLLVIYTQNGMPLEAVLIVQAWLSQFSIAEEKRIQLHAELLPAASDFLYLFETERRALAHNQPSPIQTLLGTLSARVGAVQGILQQLRCRWTPVRY